MHPGTIASVILSPLAFAGVILLTAIVASLLTAFWLRKCPPLSVRQPAREQAAKPEQPPAHLPPSPVSRDFRPVKLTFGPSRESSPAMEISAVEASALPHNKRRLDPSRNPLNAFIPFLRLVPTALTGADFGQGSYMQVLVHGPLTLASEPQTFLPFIVGNHGQVEELTQSRNSEQLRRLISSGMGWQLAFITVAYKHLADIDRKLQYVKRGVEEIKDFLTNERRSKIAGTLDYLRQVVKTLGQKESPAALRNQLEHIERELLQIQSHVVRDLGASTEKIEASIQGRFETRKTRVRTIEQRADELQELEKEWLLCMVARAINWQVLALFPGDKQFKITRKASMDKSIREFTDLLKQRYQQLYSKTAAVRSFFDSFSTTQQDKSVLVQLDLRQRLVTESNQINSDALAIREEVSRFADQLWSPQKPILLAVKLDQSKAAEAYEILQN